MEQWRELEGTWEEIAGRWKGPDLEERLREVYETRVPTDVG